MTGKRKESGLKNPAESDMPSTYASAFTDIKERIRKAQHAALRTVNKQLVGLYWDIGRIIVERQAAGRRDSANLQPLVGDLQRKFSSSGGFSTSNIWRINAFPEMFRTLDKLALLVREIAWNQNVIIIERCSAPLKREKQPKVLKGQLSSPEKIESIMKVEV